MSMHPLDLREVMVGRLELNTAALAQLGGEYILSAVRLDEANHDTLTLDAVFTDPASAWDIYLYRVHDLGAHTHSGPGDNE